MIKRIDPKGILFLIVLFFCSAVTYGNIEKTREINSGNYNNYLPPPDTISYKGLAGFCPGMSIELTAPAGSSYKWLKDNSIISGETNQKYTASTPGKYVAIVNSDTTKELIITAFTSPTTNFSFLANNQCASTPVVFTNTSTGANSYLWDFGDSKTSTQSSPSHSFNAIGNGNQTFTVKLTATNAFGCASSTSQNVTVKQIPDAKIDDYNSNKAFTNCGSQQFNLTVTNTSTTANSNSNYNIKWGDGTQDFNSSAWAANATTDHIYTTQGYFNISLSVTGQNGCKTTNNYTAYNGSNPQVPFTNPGSSIGQCVPFTYSVPSTTSNNPPGTIYIVSKNDGTPNDTLSNPPPATYSHTFTQSSCGAIGGTTPNTFYIKIRASNPCGFSDLTIEPITTNIKPKAQISISPDTIICINSSVTFTNTSINGVVVDNYGVCDNTTIKNWIVSPATGWSVSSGNIGDVNPNKNPSTWGSNNLGLTFSNPGTYNVSLIVRNVCGNDTITKKICVEAPPVPTFTASPTTGCVPFVVNINNTSTIANQCKTPSVLWTINKVSSTCITDSVNNYAFISGTTATSQNPIIRFNNQGVYNITLTITNKCGAIVSQSTTITANRKPEITLQSIPNSICLNSSISPTAVVKDCGAAATAYAWTFTDGQPSNSSQQNPGNIAYATSGTKNISLTVTNSCGATTASAVVNVTPPTSVNAGNGFSICSNKSAVTLSGFSPAGGTWSGSGISGTIFNPANATPGLNILTYKVGSGNCASEDTIQVFVTTQPQAPTATTPIQLCLNQTASPLSATGNNLMWYLGNSNSGNTTAPTPITSTVGSATYYVSQINNGCESDKSTIIVNVNALATAPTVTPQINYCQNDVPQSLTATGSSLLWYSAATGGTGSSTAPTVSTNTAGTTVYYVSQTTGCGEGPRASITVTVNAKASAAISYSPSVLCNLSNSNNANPPIGVTLTGTQGGSFSVLPASGLSVNPSTGEITPAGATAGNYTISYTIKGTGGCPDFVTRTTVSVSGAPTATINYPPLCSNKTTGAVTIIGSLGGTFSSTTGLTIDPATGNINPSASTPGNYTVTYTIPASAPCPGFTTTAPVTIIEAPTATIDYPSKSLCNVANSAATPNPPINVIHTGKNGGVYSITPSTGLPINSSTGEINPSGAAAGNYTVAYTIAAAGGCDEFVATVKLSVSGAPTATISYPNLCTSDNKTAVTLTGNTGGSFSSTTGLTIDAATGKINPSTSTPGSYTITYTIAPSAPCPGFSTTTNIIIAKAPTATISYPVNALCNVNNTPATPNPIISVIRSGDAGGTYSVAPSGLSINSANGDIDPSGATPGTYTITYTILTQSGICKTFTTSTTVNVSGTPKANISYSGSPYCGALNTPQLVNFSGNSGGTFSSLPSLSIDPLTGAINPSLSTPGNYTIYYTIAPSAPCPGFEATTQIVINEAPTINFPIDTKSICSGETAVFTPSSSVNNTIYTWEVIGSLPNGITGVSSGQTSANNNNIALSFINTTQQIRTIKVSVVPSNPVQTDCAGKPYIFNLTVNPIPTAPVVKDSVHYCMKAVATALTAETTSSNTLKWYDNNMQPLPSAPVPNTNSPATFTYYVSQYSSLCEGPTSKIVAVVHPTPKIVSSTFKNPTACGLPSGNIILNILDLDNNPISDYPLYVYYTKFQTDYKVADTSDASGKIVVPLTAGSYNNIHVETSGCASATIPDVFLLQDPNPPTKPIAGYNPPLCSGTTLNLSASSATSNLTSPVDYVWVGPAFGSTPDTTQKTTYSFPSATVNMAGTYIVYAIQNNCISAPASFQVIIKQSPEKPIIETRTPLCTGDALSLLAISSITTNDPTLNFKWTGPAGGLPINSNTFVVDKVTVKDAGKYTVSVTSPSTGCSVSSDVLIEVGAYPKVLLADDVTLPTGTNFQLNPVITNASEANVLPMKKYEWTAYDNIICNDALCSAPIAKIKTNVCYAVTATNIYGCSGTDTICIKVFCDKAQVFVPNAFTPGSGLPENNVFMVRSTGMASVKSFRIFNRWGQVVFEKTNFPPNSAAYGWDGKVNGMEANPGVYVYTLETVCENGVPYFYQGNVTLLK